MAIETEAKKVRFWGKILCSRKDVYVIEVKANKGEDFANVEKADPHGKGLNENVYWIAQDLLGEWQKLPDVKPTDIQNARKIKKMLTGNLSANVGSYPFFSGKESTLLRAQIARITAATVVVPGGVFKANAENGNNAIID